MTSLDTAALTRAVDAGMTRADALFRDVGAKTADTAGFSREPYGAGEQIAADALAAQARDLQLETATDAFGNFYMTLPGKDRAAPGWLTGSHMDTVPLGGNYDGFAGIVAGLAAVDAFRRAGITPPVDVTVMGIRAEEVSSWFGGQHDGHFGSRAALGRLPVAELDSAVNSRTGRTMREQMRDAGLDPGAVQPGKAHLQARRYRGFLELHIEQGPVLEERGVPVGIVTGIRGAVRARSCRCVGAYTHSGAVPHEYRSDAVMATVELVNALDREWTRVRESGRDLVFTVGKFFTDPKQHALTKVPGECEFCLDFRSQDRAVLDDMAAVTQQLVQRIGPERRVRFALSPFSVHLPAVMDPALRAAMAGASAGLGVRTMDIPSGAGHDAQDFAHAGFPSAMIFVRNRHGSHNPDEAMDMADFALGTRLLAWSLLQ